MDTFAGRWPGTTRAGSMRRNPAAPWRHVDLLLLGSVGFILLIGTLMVFSATRTTADTAHFAAFGPAHAPEYQVAIVLEESGFGGTAAAPVARALFDVFAGVVPMPVIQPGGGLIDPVPEGGGADGSPENPADRLGDIAEGGAD